MKTDQIIDTLLNDLASRPDGFVSDADVTQLIEDCGLLYGMHNLVRTSLEEISEAYHGMQNIDAAASNAVAAQLYARAQSLSAQEREKDLREFCRFFEEG